MSKTELEEFAARHGFQILPPDHPVYREPVAITFVSGDQHGIVDLTRAEPTGTKPETQSPTMQV